MSRPHRDGDLTRRVITIGAGMVLMVAIVVIVAPGAEPDDPPGAVAEPGTAQGEPIPAEAYVFRLRPGDLAAAPNVPRRDAAHPRTMQMYRALRAFPGAPPRIPHGLTEREFRGGRCNVCHRRGGFVARFAAYAPVNPHPELGECLQCHVADDALVGIDFPDEGPIENICFQCHVLGRDAPRYVPLDWTAPAWPELHATALPGAPPPIPHALHLRENCLACHVGAGAVEEIRTPHAERANCRQCHLETAGTIAPFDRSAIGPGHVAGGGP